MTASDYAYLEKHRQIWDSKPVLRQIYKDQFYSRLLDNLSTGNNTVEIGSGPGLIEYISPEIWRTDILSTPYIDVSVDAHALPFASGSLDNIIGLDVLHHFAQPINVIQEISRVLRPGGRFLLVEPWITPFSTLIYTYLHQEDCDLSVEPWQEESQFSDNKQAFDGNAAIPYLLTTKGYDTLTTKVPDMTLITKEPFSLFSYLLSLGFKSGSLLPNTLYKPTIAFERITAPLWKHIAALRVFLVWQKSNA